MWSILNCWFGVKTWNQSDICRRIQISMNLTLWISFLCFKKKYKNSKTYSFYCISSLFYPWHYWYLCRNVWEDYVTELGEKERDHWLERLNPSSQGLILRVHSSICCSISSCFCNRWAGPFSCSIVDCESTRNKIDLQPWVWEEEGFLDPLSFVSNCHFNRSHRV